MGPDTWQPKGTEAPVSLIPVLTWWPCPDVVALPIEGPRLCFTWPPAQMVPSMLVVGPTTVPTQIFNLPPGQLPVAMLVPLCAIWMPVVPARPDPNLTLTTQALNPFYYCSGSPSFP